MVTKEIEDLRRLFALVLEPASIFEEWEGLVTSNRVSGKHVRDARLVAALKLLGLSRILKFNVADVACYTNIEVIHPQSV